MKVEFGFQSNCSELVTHLGCVTKDEVVQGMQRLAKVTDWSWRVKAPDGETVDIPRKAITIELIPNIEEASIMEVDPRALARVLAGRVAQATLDSLNNRPQDWCMELEFTSPSGDTLTPEYQCWCGENQLHFGISTDDICDYPQFHLIRSRFGSDFMPHDGGDFFTYMAWMANYYIDEDTAMDLLEQFSSGDAEEDLELIRENPPLKGSKPPLKEDLDMIKSF